MINPQRAHTADGSRVSWVVVSALLHLAVFVQLPHVRGAVQKTSVIQAIGVDLVTLDLPPEPLSGPPPQERMIPPKEATAVRHAAAVARDHVAPPAARPATTVTGEGGPALSTPPAASADAPVVPAVPSLASPHQRTVPASSEERAGGQTPLAPPHRAPDPRERGVDHAALRLDYLTRSRSLIERYKQYPLMARKSGVEGTVLVAAMLERDGTLHRCEILQSSGSLLLDNAALRSVRAVAKFPQFPAELHADTLDLRIPITFRLIAP